VRALGHELRAACGRQREQAPLADQLGMAQRPAGGGLGVAPLAELAIDEPEVVVRFGGASPIAQALGGQERPR
jgi:hypothetical protein